MAALSLVPGPWSLVASSSSRNFFLGREEVTDEDSILLGGGTDAKIKARTVSGSVYAQEYEGDLGLRSRVGGIHADVRKVRPGDQHFWTVAGSADLTLPHTSEVALDVHGRRELLVNSPSLSTCRCWPDSRRALSRPSLIWPFTRRKSCSHTSA